VGEVVNPTLTPQAMKWDVKPYYTIPQAMKVFFQLSSADAKNYDMAKRAILAYYKLSTQNYLKEFCSMKRNGKDTYGMTLNKLKDMQLAYFEAKGINLRRFS